MQNMNLSTVFRSRPWIPLLVIGVVSGCQANAADNADAPDQTNEWTSLYRGTLDDFKIFFRGQGYIEDVNKQDVFVAEPGQIHVRKGANGLIVTRISYSHYHVKVDYRWGSEAKTRNAGLMTHVDLESKAIEDNRPASIEINMRHDCPGSIWLARGLGPFASTYIDKSARRPRYLPRDRGGVAHDATPFGDPIRTIRAHYPDNKIPTRQYGEWNTFEAIVRGADSVEIILNGHTVNRLHRIRAIKEGTEEPGESFGTGGIGLQSEGQEVFYRNFMIKKLKP